MKPPFVNLSDIAGILMIVLAQAIILAALGSSLISWKFVVLTGVLFYATIYFAKKGTPS